MSILQSVEALIRDHSDRQTKVILQAMTEMEKRIMKTLAELDAEIVGDLQDAVTAIENAVTAGRANPADAQVQFDHIAAIAAGIRAATAGTTPTVVIPATVPPLTAEARAASFRPPGYIEARQPGVRGPRQSDHPGMPGYVVPGSINQDALTLEIARLRALPGDTYAIPALVAIQSANPVQALQALAPNPQAAQSLAAITAGVDSNERGRRGYDGRRNPGQPGYDEQLDNPEYVQRGQPGYIEPGQPGYPKRA